MLNMFRISFNSGYMHSLKSTIKHLQCWKLILVFLTNILHDLMPSINFSTLSCKYMSSILCTTSYTLTHIHIYCSISAIYKKYLSLMIKINLWFLSRVLKAQISWKQIEKIVKMHGFDKKWKKKFACIRVHLCISLVSCIYYLTIYSPFRH